MSSVYLPATFRNFCVFQLLPNYQEECNRYDAPQQACSSDKNIDDGTFVCNYHLRRMFKIEKKTLEIPSGVGQSFKMLIGSTLIQQNDERRVMIPTRSNYEAHFRVPSLTPVEKYVLHVIYGEEGKAREVCEALRDQECYPEAFWIKNTSIVTMLVAMTNPHALCRPESIRDVRIFDNSPSAAPAAAERAAEGGEPAEPASHRVFMDMPPFIQNLIRRLVRPQVLVLGTERLVLEQLPTCDLVAGQGLTAPRLYNPVKPSIYAGYLRELRFELRTVVEFEGAATRYQNNLSGYEVFKIIRVLLLGTETIPSVPM